MNIVVTGAHGFIGKNLCVMLADSGYNSIIQIDSDSTLDTIKHALSIADFVFHLAGINRPQDESEFKKGNTDFTEFLVSELKANGRNTPIMLSSSIQASLDNPYGASKAQAEALVSEYSKKANAKVFIYRFPNVFGKWCRPNYNSFVATFCHNIVNNIEINIHNRSAPVTLVYIDDVCHELIALLENSGESGFREVSVEYKTTVGEVADLLMAFNESRDTLVTEHVGSGLPRALYSTYLSYFEPSKFHYTLPKHEDERGVFCEMLKTKESGQFSVFTAHKGITRGGHYHHSKNEKFLVIKGEALFKFQHVVTGERYELVVASGEATVVETVPGWSHDITNIGEEELIVMLWANEIFDRKAPDTIVKPL
ncbi:UDP-2-acetamido-2,6-beta-L-arabino-hexul-4-ose reductase [Vibrio sp. WXL210]|uniref:UDP-2-acetamido-2,6-beta-L-arabino-hexul-4-ose reductase n=1 Tax=Vibrio sp. WXL210 TaxID=3450709 RepID=UPI003EC6A26C